MRLQLAAMMVLMGCGSTTPSGPQPPARYVPDDDTERTVVAHAPPVDAAPVVDAPLQPQTEMDRAILESTQVVMEAKPDDVRRALAAPAPMWCAASGESACWSEREYCEKKVKSCKRADVFACFDVSVERKVATRALCYAVWTDCVTASGKGFPGSPEITSSECALYKSPTEKDATVHNAAGATWCATRTNRAGFCVRHEQACSSAERCAETNNYACFTGKVENGGTQELCWDSWERCVSSRGALLDYPERSHVVSATQCEIYRAY